MAMDRDSTRTFIREAKAFAKRKRWNTHTLSRHLFNQNPYGFQRLEDAMKNGTGGPPHINVLDAAERLAELKAEAEEGERTLCM